MVSEISQVVERAHLPCPYSALIERAAHSANCRWQIAHDEFGLDPNDAVPRASELAIAERIRGFPACVIGAINLDDEARARRMEGSDEPEQRNLPPKRDTELA